jgi:hypothetical protein
MNRARLSFAAATLVFMALGTGISTISAMQSQTPAPPMKSVLAGRKLTPPARGEVVVEFTDPTRKVVKDMVVTTFQVKNVGLAPIARLTITQTWFDKASQVVGGGKGSVNGLLAPGAVETIVIESVSKPIYNSDSFNFTHANGSVRPKKVAKFPPATPAAGAKPAAPAATTKK